jgi:hypothetical protein
MGEVGLRSRPARGDDLYLLRGGMALPLALIRDRFVLGDWGELCILAAL